jgi:hypothetical protein
MSLNGLSTLNKGDYVKNDATVQTQNILDSFLSHLCKLDKNI